MQLKQVLEFIVNVTQNASKSEENKLKLNDHPTFEPYALFSRFDRDDKGFLINEDFINFLIDSGIEISSNRGTLNLFVEYYDRDFDNKINFGEFWHFILNKDHNVIRSIATQRETYKLNCDEFLEKDLEEATAKLLLSEFYLFEYANVKKMELFSNRNKDSNQNDWLNLFIEMDCDKDGYITCDDLQTFWGKRKIKICDEELMSFISIYDEDLDGMLNWNEFWFMILPSPMTYEYNWDELKNLEKGYNEYYSKRRDDKLNNSYTIPLNNGRTEKGNDIGNKNNLNNLMISNNSNPRSDNLTYSINNNNNMKSQCGRLKEEPYLQKQSKFEQSQNYQSQAFKQSNSLSQTSTHYQGRSSKKNLDIFNIFIQIIEFETQIESLRIKLSSNPSFNLQQFFEMFDQYNNNYISFMDFADILENVFDIQSKNSILLFSKYDVESTGRIKQENFYSMFLPQSKEIDNQILNASLSNESKKDLPWITKTNVTQWINCLITYMTFMSTLPKWYTKHKDEIDIAFNIMDKDKKGYINEEDFTTFFADAGVEIGIEDWWLWMEKIDEDKDGKITYEDIVNLFN